MILDWPLSTLCSFCSKHTDHLLASLRCLCLFCFLSLPISGSFSPFSLVFNVPVSARSPHLHGLCGHSAFQPPADFHHLAYHRLSWSIGTFACRCRSGRKYLYCLQGAEQHSVSEQAERQCSGGMVPASSSLHRQRLWWLLRLYLQLAAPSLCCDSFLVRDRFRLKSA